MTKTPTEEQIEELCEKANIRKPYQFTSWIFMRADGVDKQDAASMIGISEKTLKRYEDKVDKNLEDSERFLLTKLAVDHEFAERIDLEV